MDYSRLIAPAAAEMRPSGIRKFFDIAAEMDDCISLGVGEPDFKTPWRIRDAGIKSLQKGKINKKGHNPVEVIDESLCIGCAFCATMCPDCIITVEK